MYCLCDRGRLDGAAVKTLVVAALLVGVGCSSPRAEPQSAPARVPVVVTVVVDQFAAWVASERLPLLPEDGGFARLRREGTYVKALRYEHAATETACGHAALYTGAPPSRTGVMSNEALDQGRVVSTMQDDDTRLVTAAGVSDIVGASPKVLRVEGLADVFREAHPDAFIAGLSLKDRGAILPVGRKPSAAIWNDLDSGELVTSTYFARALPSWAADVSRGLARRLEQPWTLLDAEWVKAHAVGPDDQPGEAPHMHTFPHDLKRETTLGAAIRLSPTSNDALVDLALAGIDAEVKPGRPVFIAISFSTNDLVGHTFGPDSWEEWDQLRRLDTSLGRLMSGLDKRFGKDGYAIALSADHGVAPIPEVQPMRPECTVASAANDRWDRPCKDATRVSRRELATQMSQTSRDLLGDGKWVYGFVGAFVALTPEGRAKREQLVPALIARLKDNPAVADAIDVRSLPKECPSGGETLEALACHAYPPGSAGDILVVLRRGAGFGEGSGANHGMPYTYDLTIPFLVRAPGRVQAGRVIEDELPAATFTRTVARLLGTRVPSAASEGRVID